jgi:hypothetical protein
VALLLFELFTIGSDLISISIPAFLPSASTLLQHDHSGVNNENKHHIPA